jgi:hypothetical protein
MSAKKLAILIFIMLITIILIDASQFSGPDQLMYSHDYLRILEINVWSGLNYKGILKMGEYETAATREKRYQALCSQIKKLDPDIIGINEANKLPKYAERLAKDMGYAAFYHIGVGGVRLGAIGLPWNLREGDAILTKKYLNPQYLGRKQLSGGYVGNWATFHFSDATQIIAIKITFQDRPIFIFATHWHSSLSDDSNVLKKAQDLFNSGEITAKDYQTILEKIKEGVDERISESKKTVDFIKEIAGNQLYILMGDFNAESGSQEINDLKKFGMVDVFQISNPDSSGFTWDPRTNLNFKTYYLREHYSEKDSNAYNRFENLSDEIPKRVDYIFLGPSFLLDNNSISLRSSKVVMKEVIHGVHTSDHYGVFAEIQINH